MHLVDRGSPHGHVSIDCVSSVLQDRISSFLVPKIVHLRIRPLSKNSQKESIQLSLTMVSSQTIDEAVSVSSLICAKEWRWEGTDDFTRLVDESVCDHRKLSPILQPNVFKDEDRCHRYDDRYRLWHTNSMRMSSFDRRHRRQSRMTICSYLFSMTILLVFSAYTFGSNSDRIRSVPLGFGNRK